MFMAIFTLADCLFGQEVDEAALRSLALQFEANRASLTQGRFEFHFVRGLASDLDHALEGKLDQVHIEMDGVLAIDRGRMRYERVDRDMKPTTSTTNRQVLIESSSRNLFDGRSTVHDVILMPPESQDVLHSVIRSAGPEAFLRMYRFPISMGPVPLERSGLRVDIETALEGRDEARVKSMGQADPDGARTNRPTVIRLGLRKRDRVYTVDREHGAIPIRVVSEPAQGPHTTEINDRISLVGGSYVPFRSVAYSEPGRLTTIITVTSASLDQPKAEDFVLTFDTPVPLLDRIESAYYGRRDRWGLTGFPSRGAKDFIAVEKKPAAKAAVPSSDLSGEREPWPRWVMVAIAATGIVLVAALLLVRRRRDGHAA